MVTHYKIDFEGRAITSGDKEAIADLGGVGGCERKVFMVLILRQMS